MTNCLPLHNNKRESRMRDPFAFFPNLHSSSDGGEDLGPVQKSTLPNNASNIQSYKIKGKSESRCLELVVSTDLGGCVNVLPPNNSVPEREKSGTPFTKPRQTYKTRRGPRMELVHTKRPSCVHCIYWPCSSS